MNIAAAIPVGIAAAYFVNAVVAPGLFRFVKYMAEFAEYAVFVGFRGLDALAFAESFDFGLLFV